VENIRPFRRAAFRWFAWAACALAWAAAGPASPAGGQPETRVQIKEIRVYGNTVTSRRVILQYCEFREGDLLTVGELTRKIKRTKRNLENTHFFARVNVFDLPRPDPGRATIMIDVAEGSTWHVAASTRQVRVSRENIGGEAVTLGVEGGLDRERVFYNQPWVFDQDLEASAAPFFENRHLTSIENDRGEVGEWFYHDAVGGEGGLGYIITRRSASGLNLLVEHVDYFDDRFKADPWGRFGVAPHANLFALRPYARWDNRDDELYPTRGFFVEARGELAPAGVGDYEYKGIEGDLRGYVSPGLAFVVASRILAGTMTETTPYIRRIDIHGSEGLRTINSYRTVGTRAFLATVELRRKLFRSPIFDAWFEGVAFLDAGRTWDPGQPFRFEYFDYAFGPGVRLHMRSPFYFDWRGELNVHGDLAIYASARRAF